MIDFCRSALAQCSLLQHPSVEPLPPLTSSSPLEGSLVAPPPPAVQPSHYQLRDGRHSRSITPLPVLDVPQPQRELSPVLMETLPSIQLPSLSAKLLPSVSTFGKESDRTKMEIDLTKDEEVPPETKPKINFISTSSNEKSLDEWFASDDPVAMDEEGKNTPVHVAKNATTSSSKNLSSLPATSTAGLHQPSVQDVGNSEAKKGLSDSATTADDAKPSSSGVAAALSSSSSELASKEEKRIVPLRGKNSDSDSDSSVVSGLEFFVDKSPDREIID